MNDVQKKEFVEWSSAYETILLNDSSKNYLLNKGSHQRPFVYVEDEKTCTIMTMFLGAGVSKIEEFISRETLNTDNKDSLDVSDEHSTTICN